MSVCEKCNKVIKGSKYKETDSDITIMRNGFCTCEKELIFTCDGNDPKDKCGLVNKAESQLSHAISEQVELSKDKETLMTGMECLREVNKDLEKKLAESEKRIKELEAGIQMHIDIKTNGVSK